MAKKNVNQILVVVAILAVVALVFNVGGIRTTIFGGEVAVTPTTPTGAAPVTTCPYEDTTMTITALDELSAGTSMTGYAADVFINDVDKGLKASGSSITVSPGDKYSICFLCNETDHYYGHKFDGTVPCAGTFELQGTVIQVSSAPTTTIFRSTGDVMTTSVEEALVADEVKTIKYRIQSGSKESVGNPYHKGLGNIVCAQYNQTTYDDVTFFDLDGTARPNAYQPKALTAVVSEDVSCYYINAGLKNNGIEEYTIEIDTSATQPTAGTSGNEANITVNLYDVSVDYDADTNEFINDVQDEDKNDLGDQTVVTDEIYVS